MTPKEKAKELYLKFCPYDIMYCDPLGQEIEGYYERYAKQCALICCNEVLGYMGADRGYEFWTEVKEEINKL